MSDVQTDELTGQATEYDSLFGGEKLPSLFDKTMGVGISRTGIITKAPEDRQSRFYKAGGMGALKYWHTDGKPTEKPMDAWGKPNRPCMDTVFVLSTEYRFNEHELADREMDEDNGDRGVFASGAQYKAIQGAIKESGVKTRAGLIGMRLTLTRTGKAIKGDFETWKWAAKLERVAPEPAPF